MRRIIYIPWIILLCWTFAQLPFDYKLITASNLGRFESVSDTGLASNRIMDIRNYDDELLFFGTGAGLSFADLSSPSNIQYGHFIASELPSGGNPALAIGNGIIAVSGVVDTPVLTGSEQKGTGIAYSRNGGNNWIYLHQSIDSTSNSDSIWHCPYTNSPQSEFYLAEDICSEACYDDNGKSDECHNLYQWLKWGGQDSILSLLVTTEVHNISYDIAVGNKYIYTANWAGGLRRYNHLPSTTEGIKNWEIVPLPGDNDLDLYCGEINVEYYQVNPKDPADGGNHNHKGFGVYLLDNILWVGTAAGINKGIISGDCIDWVQHYQYGLDNLSGNWVIGFTHQEFESFTRLWAITWARKGPEFTGEKNALSYTDDGGENWYITNPIGNESGQVYNVTSHGDSVWASTEIGLYISGDGEHWEKYDRPIDIETGEEILSEYVYSAYYSQLDQTLWVGTDDGLALINDETSNVTRFWDSPSPFSAYPNPFLLNDEYNQVGNDGYMRFIYSNPNDQPGKIDIFDFAMDHIILLNNSNPISLNGENEIIWNGRNEYGDKVANGVYFCRLSLQGSYYWTKLAVVN